jgi:hypothetical protein
MNRDQHSSLLAPGVSDEGKGFVILTFGCNFGRHKVILVVNVMKLFTAKI